MHVGSYMFAIILATIAQQLRWLWDRLTTLSAPALLPVLLLLTVLPLLLLQPASALVAGSAALASVPSPVRRRYWKR
jgi:hypothetical protein